MWVGSSFYKIEVPFNDANQPITILHQAWSHSDTSILAVASSDGHVQLYSEEDDTISLLQTLTRTSRKSTLVTSPPLPPQPNGTGPVLCRAMAWHPYLPLLIACWEDGGMSVWLEGRGLVTDESPDRVQVPSVISFSASGTRFIVGDENGQAILCQLDSRFRISALRRFVRQSAITHATFRLGGVPGTLTEGLSGPVGGFGGTSYVDSFNNNNNSSAFDPQKQQQQQQQLQQAETNCFFFGTRAGTLFYVNETFVCSELGGMSVNLLSLHYDPPSSTLYVIGANASFAVLTLSKEGKVVNERRAKLSGVNVPIAVRPESNAQSDGTSTQIENIDWKQNELRMAWAGRATLVIVNGESLVRVWHLNDDETYVLNLSNISNEIADEHICQVEFDSVNRTLITSTLEGTAVLWRHLAKNTGSASSKSNGTILSQDDLVDDDQPYELPNLAPSPQDWEPLPCARLLPKPMSSLPSSPKIVGLATCPREGLISATTVFPSRDGAGYGCGMVTLKRSHLARSCRDGLTAVQSTPESILLVRPTAAVLAASADNVSSTNQLSNFHFDASSAREKDAADISAFRFSPGSSIVLQGQPTQSELLWRPGFRVRGVDTRGDIAIAYGAKRIEIVEVRSGTVVSLGAFAHPGIKNFVLGTQIIFAISGPRIDFYTFGGVVKHSIELDTESEGLPIRVDVSSSGVLLCLTSRGIIKTWDVLRREIRPILHARSLADDEGLIQEVTKLLPVPSATGFEDTNITLLIQQVAISAQGQRIAFTVIASRGTSLPSVQPIIAVYDFEQDTVYVDRTPGGAIPLTLAWDAKHPLLLSYESAPLRLGDTIVSRNITMLFFSSNTAAGAGLFLQERLTIANDSEALVGLASPYVFVLSWRLSASSSTSLNGEVPVESGIVASLRRPIVCKRVMRDFAGLDEADDEIHQDLMNFSYYLALGLIDDAHQAVQKIQAPAVWRSMATMSVRTRRVDVARLCLTHMQDARAAWLMRDAILRSDSLPSIIMKNYGDDENKTSARKDENPRPTSASADDTPNSKSISSEDLVQLGVLGCILGMEAEAEQLYREAGRIDLLTELLGLQGKSADAVQLCQTESKVLLPAVQFERAKRLEIEGRLPQAISLYYACGAVNSEIPRLIHDTADPLVARAIDELLESNAGDDRLSEWVGNHQLVRRRYGEAIQCFSRTSKNDGIVYAYVRRGQLDKAEALCKQTNDPSACLALARQFESRENVEKAVEYYVRAKRYAQGVRLCKEHKLTSMLQRLALEGPSSIQLEVANFFEENGQIEQAVMLYQRGGNPARAVELCFSAKLFGHLKTIVENIGPEADPTLLARCADFFLMNGEFTRAAHLLVSAGKNEQALELCFAKSIPMDEDLAEKLTPPKLESASEADKKRRKSTLTKIAEACRDQGLFQVACKKFTQAGDPIRAMQCLIKSNDTEKICYYAQKVRSREVHILAARYLEHLNWREDPEIMRRIVQFYTLAKSHEALYRFYDLCAHYEIDEFRSYEKAHGAMTEAHKWLIAALNANAPNITNQLIASYETRLNLLEQFVKARQLAQTDPEGMVRACESLVGPATSTIDTETGLRAGDVYALLVEYHNRKGDNRSALDAINRMKGAGIPLGPYLDANLVREILARCGMHPSHFDSDFGFQQEHGGQSGSTRHADEIDEEGELDEEIAEDF